MTSLRCVVIGAALTAAACASAPRVPPSSLTPKYPAFVEPTIPPNVPISADLRQRQTIGWQWLQAGDLPRARHEFEYVVKRSPTFYPAYAGLGYVALADKDYKHAAEAFAKSLSAADGYVPAWIGKAEAEVALGDDADAIVALERVRKLDPKRDGIQTRLDLVRFRRAQALIEQGRNARIKGRLDDARAVLTEALAVSPSSTAVISELAMLEQQAGALDRAEAHARRLVQVDAGSAEALALLAGILEAREKIGEAATFYGRAAAIDPREEWRSKASTLRERAEAAALPEAVRSLPAAATITRGDVAAYVGLKLGPLLGQAAPRPAQVATDIRDHWAARWIPAVTRAGVMRVYENHTFQPNALVRRGDLALIAANLVELAGGRREPDLVRWRAARPRFADLPATHVFYRPAALAVSAGALSADDTGRFLPTRPATGAELVEVVDRITQITQRR